MADLAAQAAEALQQVEGSQSLAALDELRVHWLGKKGLITQQLQSLRNLSGDERSRVGAAVNAAKDQVAAAIEARKLVLEQAAINAALESGRIDVSLPGRGEPRGGLHPVTRVRLRIEEAATGEATSGGMESIDAADTKAAVERGLLRLPEEQREVLVLRLFDEKSYAEIATITGRKVGTVGWLISIGMKALAAELAPLAGGFEASVSPVVPEVRSLQGGVS